jgi:hypothetical protein
MIDTVEENRFSTVRSGKRAVVIESNSPDGPDPVAWPIHGGMARLGPRHGRFVTALPQFIPRRS